MLEHLDVDLLIDGGANAGQYAAEVRRTGFRGRILSFEPLSDPFVTLSAQARADSAWDCRREALSDCAGEALINVSANSWSSSLLPITPTSVAAAPDSAYIGEEAITTVRLDDVLSQAAPYARTLLKLDVQGSELAALRGAEETLARVVAVEVELSLCPLYAGGPAWREVADHLEAHDLRLAGVQPEFFDDTTGLTLQVNGTFVRVDQVPGVVRP
jgi:FkbM family methyltransferase